MKVNKLSINCSKTEYVIITNKKVKPQLACLHDQSKSGFFRGPAFIQPIGAI